MVDNSKRGIGNTALRFLSIENPYRRVARFYPALATIALLLPAAIMLGIPLSGWMIAMSSGGGFVVATAAVGLVSHLASAAGNRVQSELYPRWPCDSPTHLRLHPKDQTSSKQQKEKWYAAIERLCGISIRSVADDHEEAERAINDAVSMLRTKVFFGNKLAERLDMHNADYGQVRNFAGLRPVWLLTSFASVAVCWITFAVRQEHLAFPATALFVGCLFAAVVIKPYVRQTARHYADSSFGALEACDETFQTKQKKKGPIAALFNPVPTPAAAEPPSVGHESLNTLQWTPFDGGSVLI
jgi:hypothetical protein